MTTAVTSQATGGGSPIPPDPGAVAVRSLRALSAACFEALGPASRWGGVAFDNANAIDARRVPGEWLRNRADDWRAFATRTDPDLATLALAAATALDALAKEIP